MMRASVLAVAVANLLLTGIIMVDGQSAVGPPYTPDWPSLAAVVSASPRAAAAAPHSVRVVTGPPAFAVHVPLVSSV